MTKTQKRYHTRRQAANGIKYAQTVHALLFNGWCRASLAKLSAPLAKAMARALIRYDRRVQAGYRRLVRANQFYQEGK